MPGGEPARATIGSGHPRRRTSDGPVNVFTNRLRLVIGAHLGAEVDGEALLDLAAGAAYYRLLWRGVALTEKQAEPLVDLILTGAS